MPTDRTLTEAGDDLSREIAAILARFVRYHPDRIDLSLDRMYRLLDDLGNPQDALPPTIHIAGTNGKGSVAAFLASALEVGGKTVSVYTSPHLVRFAERYRIAGAPLSDAALLALFEEVETLNAGKPATEFEITTAAAFLAMSRTPADFVVLETGLGGRFDATNVVRQPAATVITRIGLDHMNFLGPDIASIAGEKAAIQKKGAPSILAPQESGVAEVVTAAAEAIGAPLYRAGQEWEITPSDDGSGVYRRADTVWPLPPPGLPGRHQLDNAATAAACLEICGFPGIARDTVAIGIRNVTWPGRMEWVQRGALADLLPRGWELWLDAAHNPQGAQALADAFRALNRRAPRPLHLVFAVLSDKDIPGFLAPFRGLVETATAVPIVDEARASPVAELVREAGKAGLDARGADSVSAAVVSLTDRKGPARILVAGSHHLLGAAMAANRQHRDAWLDQIDGGHYCAH